MTKLDKIATIDDQILYAVVLDSKTSGGLYDHTSALFVSMEDALVHAAEMTVSMNFGSDQVIVCTVVVDNDALRSALRYRDVVKRVPHQSNLEHIPMDKDSQ